MKLHTVFITYNRLEITKQALRSYVETVNVPYSYVIVDNGSDRSMRRWLEDWASSPDCGALFLTDFLGENKYPGFAANRGWERVFCHPEATHLHRADNDFRFLPGWCQEAERVFAHIRTLGQLGLRTNAEESINGIPVQTNVGGNCILLKELWDRGLRWDERPWPQIRDEVGKGWTEDSLMSKSVGKMGYHWGRVSKPCIVPISGFEDPEDPYYKQSWADRGIYQ
jgi:hypothetical protein